MYISCQWNLFELLPLVEERKKERSRMMQEETLCSKIKTIQNPEIADDFSRKNVPKVSVTS